MHRTLERTREGKKIEKKKIGKEKELLVYIELLKRDHKLEENMVKIAEKKQDQKHLPYT